MPLVQAISFRDNIGDAFLIAGWNFMSGASSGSFESAILERRPKALRDRKMIAATQPFRASISLHTFEEGTNFKMFDSCGVASRDGPTCHALHLRSFLAPLVPLRSVRSLVSVITILWAV